MADLDPRSRHIREFDINRLGIEARQFVFDRAERLQHLAGQKHFGAPLRLNDCRPTDPTWATTQGAGAALRPRLNRDEAGPPGAALPGLLFDPHRQFPALGAAMDDRCPCGHAGGRPQRSCARSTPCSFVDPAQAD
jgi:hypothetical protein